MSFGVIFAVSSFAQAKTPPEILKPYKKYKTALENGRSFAAAEAAYEAWQAAEALVGPSKLTGDLANNFAFLDPLIVNGRKTSLDVMKAHERGIELAYFHQAMAMDVEIQRRIKFAEWSIDKKQSKALKNVELAITKFNKWDTTYGAEYYALKTQQALVLRKYDSVIENAEKAIELFSSATDGLPSQYKYFTRVYQAEAYRRKNRIVDAALTYQALLDEMAKTVGVNNTIADYAYADWQAAKYELQNKAKYKSISKTKVMVYEPPTALKDKTEAVVRIPPIMPPRAVKSGRVFVRFDVDKLGNVINEEVIGSTHGVFERPSLISLRKWKYKADLPEEKRKGVESKITFRLTDQYGRLIPE